MAPKRDVPIYDYDYDDAPRSGRVKAEPEAPKESEKDKFVAQFKKLHAENEPLYSEIFAQLRAEGYPV